MSKIPAPKSPAKAPSNTPKSTVADPTTAFLKEVDDALQQEKIAYIWQTYRFIIIGGVAALLLAVLGWQVYQNQQVKHASAIASDWHTYQTGPADSPEKAALLKQIESQGSTGYRALALFAEAVSATDAQAAQTAYAKVYEDGAQPSWLREAARLNAALRLMGSDNAAAQTELEKLVTYADPREASAASAIALEQLSVLAILRGDAVSAKGYTQKMLQIPHLSADLRQRAEKRMGAL